MRSFLRWKIVATVVTAWFYVGFMGKVCAQNNGLDKTVKLRDETVSTQTQVTEPKKTNAYEFVAVVNGQPISKSFYELNLQEWLEQGQKDSDRLRKNLKEELINRELILQEMVNRGLDGEINWQDQIKQLKQKLAVQILTNQYLKEQGLTEKGLKQDYQNQKKQNFQNEALVQYKVQQISVREKSLALALLGRLQQGESFDTVAKGVPASMGVVTLGWLNVSQISPELSETIAKLPIGGVIETPIPADGMWSIIRLEDKRSNTAPSFEEYKSQVVQLKLREFYSQTLKQLRSQANIHQ